ncbi:phosphoribosyltransferase [Microbulbifer agarilyticus]|uniref:phosphoribosyltransferase n=1 Tax=Microbulbifer agarilyticus TaxID=260552 RepID=UPI001C95BCA2|nr:phosphoribosyltransferase family protein [Microbulbifer agarilyticus]MBY6190082.1 hypoxanthine phosphoribosyltransferase [Microbulbifer agarilyticus]MBY6210083.1 hypoxanthine phosphoribosyltransferase [Microbulbifer agarilyticus]MCA0892573.1 hypoxanthine phosphoribosyltransferase [Microbulbifer agarilyticus]
MSEKQYISAQSLLDDSYTLALKVVESGFQPDYIVGVWRGGAPIGIAVQEMFDFLGFHADHIAIRTSSYSGVNQRQKEVKVHGLTYLIKQVESHEKMLIVDDVYDTGLSIQQAISDMRKAAKKNTPEIRVACPYFKPSRNQTDMEPDYYLHETDKWLVFPHELKGLSMDEILENKQELRKHEDKLRALKKNG